VRRPIRIELIPAVRRTADQRFQLRRERLRGRGDRRVAVAFARDDDRIAGDHLVGLTVTPDDRAGQQRRAREIPEQRRRAHEERAPAEERDGHAIAIDVAIHQHRDDAVVGQPPADL
jgi:hypothetical protein